MEYYHVLCLLVFENKCTMCRESEIPIEDLSEVDCASISSNEVQNLNEKIEKIEKACVEFYTNKYKKKEYTMKDMHISLKGRTNSQIYIFVDTENGNSILKVCEGMVVENEDLHEHGVDEVYIEKRKTLPNEETIKRDIGPYSNDLSLMFE